MSEPIPPEIEQLLSADLDRSKIYDPKERGQFREPVGRAPRPKDAATLVLVRRDQNEPRILMGRRAGGHAFMPDKYVFPGGRVDRHDARALSASELQADTAHRLSVQSRRPARALAIAAIRETWEETGLLIAKPGKASATFSDQEFAPHLEPLRFIARAITPPHRHKRFDARFFLAYAEDALWDDRALPKEGELLELDWLTLAQIADLDLPNITRFILREITQILDPASPDPAPPFLRWASGQHQLDRLS